MGRKLWINVSNHTVSGLLKSSTDDSDIKIFTWRDYSHASASPEWSSKWNKLLHSHWSLASCQFFPCVPSPYQAKDELRIL